MIVFPNAKINLGLNIIRKRPDGYHELETCFYPVPWNDILEIIESDSTIFSSTGIAIPDDGENIVLKAYQLLSDKFKLPSVQIHLHKVIPIGAGVGGGSSDAAFTIKLLNELFKIGLSEQKMIAYATKLGADCAFFIKNKPCLASGIGENLTLMDISLDDKYLLVVYPDMHISTKVAFSGMVPKAPDKKIVDILNQQLDSWKSELINDFENSLFNQIPQLNDIKMKLYDAGAHYASMSGSGSCIYGIFDAETKIDMPVEYTCFSIVL